MLHFPKMRYLIIISFSGKKCVCVCVCVGGGGGEIEDRMKSSEGKKKRKKKPQQAVRVINIKFLQGYRSCTYSLFSLITGEANNCTAGVGYMLF